MVVLPFRRLTPALLGLLLLPASPARAVFVAHEMEALDTEPLFDTEYFLDLRGFAYPLEWDALWANAAGPAYRINSASLDRSDLFIEQEARMPKRLNDWFAFSYDLVHRGDKDVVSLHNWISLAFGPFRGLTFTLFGEPSFAKEDADIGLRTAYAVGETAAVYVSADAVDFNFNKRGRTTQRYDKKPFSLDLGGRLRLGEDRLRAGVEIDTPLVRTMPDENRIYKYRRVNLHAGWTRADFRGWDLKSGYAYSFKRETSDYSPDTLNRTQDFHRGAHLLSAAGARALGEKDRLESGFDYMSRRGESDFANDPLAGSRHGRWELMPYVRWRRAVRPWAVAEAAFFLSFGEKRQIFDSDAVVSITDKVTEAKLGLGTDFLYGETGRIGLYGTFDLDDAGRHLWDGGNIRALFLF